MSENEIAAIVVDSCVKIHKALGPGLLETVYQHVLVHELRKAGLNVATEIPISVVWDGVGMEAGFRADIIVNAKLLIEVKSVEQIAAVHKKQVLTYLKLTGLKLGLLINFGGEVVRGNITRVANGLEETVTTAKR